MQPPRLHRPWRDLPLFLDKRALLVREDAADAAELLLRNDGAGACVFKMKTNRPHDYEVIPSVGLVPAGGHAVVTFRFIGTPQDPSSDPFSRRDRFEVLARPITPREAEAVAFFASGDEHAGRAALNWTHPDADDLGGSPSNLFKRLWSHPTSPAPPHRVSLDCTLEPAGRYPPGGSPMAFPSGAHTLPSGASASSSAAAFARRRMSAGLHTPAGDDDSIRRPSAGSVRRGRQEAGPPHAARPNACAPIVGSANGAEPTFSPESDSFIRGAGRAGVAACAPSTGDNVLSGENQAAFAPSFGSVNIVESTFSPERDSFRGPGHANSGSCGGEAAAVLASAHSIQLLPKTVRRRGACNPAPDTARTQAEQDLSPSPSCTLSQDRRFGTTAGPFGEGSRAGAFPGREPEGSFEKIAVGPAHDAASEQDLSLSCTLSQDRRFGTTAGPFGEGSRAGAFPRREPEGSFEKVAAGPAPDGEPEQPRDERHGANGRASETSLFEMFPAVDGGAGRFPPTARDGFQPRDERHGANGRASETSLFEMFPAVDGGAGGPTRATGRPFEKQREVSERAANNAFREPPEAANRRATEALFEKFPPAVSEQEVCPSAPSSLTSKAGTADSFGSMPGEIQQTAALGDNRARGTFLAGGLEQQGHSTASGPTPAGDEWKRKEAVQAARPTQAATADVLALSPCASKPAPTPAADEWKIKEVAQATRPTEAAAADFLALSPHASKPEPTTTAAPATRPTEAAASDFLALSPHASKPAPTTTTTSPHAPDSVGGLQQGPPPAAHFLRERATDMYSHSRTTDFSSAGETPCGQRSRGGVDTARVHTQPSTRSSPPAAHFLRERVTDMCSRTTDFSSAEETPCGQGSRGGVDTARVHSQPSARSGKQKWKPQRFWACDGIPSHSSTPTPALPPERQRSSGPSRPHSAAPVATGGSDRFVPRSGSGPSAAERECVLPFAGGVPDARTSYPEPSTEPAERRMPQCALAQPSGAESSLSACLSRESSCLDGARISISPASFASELAGSQAYTRLAALGAPPIVADPRSNARRASPSLSADEPLTSRQVQGGRRAHPDCRTPRYPMQGDVAAGGCWPCNASMPPSNPPSLVCSSRSDSGGVLPVTQRTLCNAVPQDGLQSYADFRENRRLASAPPSNPPSPVRSITFAHSAQSDALSCGTPSVRANEAFAPSNVRANDSSASSNALLCPPSRTSKAQAQDTVAPSNSQPSSQSNAQSYANSDGSSAQSYVQSNPSNESLTPPNACPESQAAVQSNPYRADPRTSFYVDRDSLREGPCMSRPPSPASQPEAETARSIALEFEAAIRSDIYADAAPSSRHSSVCTNPLRSEAFPFRSAHPPTVWRTRQESVPIHSPASVQDTALFRRSSDPKAPQAEAHASTIWGIRQECVPGSSGGSSAGAVRAAAMPGPSSACLKSADSRGQNSCSQAGFQQNPALRGEGVVACCMRGVSEYAEQYEPGVPSVVECLRSFFSPEKLEDDNLYHCGKCNTKCPAEKQLSIAYSERLTSGQGTVSSGVDSIRAPEGEGNRGRTGFLSDPPSLAAPSGQSCQSVVHGPSASDPTNAHASGGTDAAPSYLPSSDLIEAEASETQHTSPLQVQPGTARRHPPHSGAALGDGGGRDPTASGTARKVQDAVLASRSGGIPDAPSSPWLVQDDAWEGGNGEGRHQVGSAPPGAGRPAHHAQNPETRRRSQQDAGCGQAARKQSPHRRGHQPSPLPKLQGRVPGENPVFPPFPPESNGPHPKCRVPTETPMKDVHIGENAGLPPFPMGSSDPNPSCHVLVETAKSVRTGESLGSSSYFPGRALQERPRNQNCPPAEPGAWQKDGCGNRQPPRPPGGGGPEPRRRSSAAAPAKTVPRQLADPLPSSSSGSSSPSRPRILGSDETAKARRGRDGGAPPSPAADTPPLSRHHAARRGDRGSLSSSAARAAAQQASGGSGAKQRRASPAYEGIRTVVTDAIDGETRIENLLRQVLAMKDHAPLSRRPARRNGDTTSAARPTYIVAVAQPHDPASEETEGQGL
ncbi:hypothetical protein DIPPA_30871 [Diplonema papillatum]|nr:hypothetical protein DIPPA_30871 [Diplonema papillatum]